MQVCRDRDIIETRSVKQQEKNKMFGGRIFSKKEVIFKTAKATKEAFSGVFFCKPSPELYKILILYNSLKRYYPPFSRKRFVFI